MKPASDKGQEQSSSALRIGAAGGDLNFCRQLLADGADVNSCDSLSLTALHIAAKMGHPALCAILLDAGAAMEAKDRDGATPLILAASGTSKPVFDLLVGHGADVNVRTMINVTALYRAAQAGHTGYCRLLLDKGASVKVEARLDSRNIVKPEGRETALHAAVRGGYLDICKLLVKHGANPSHRPRPLYDREYLSPVQLAVSEKMLDIARHFLLECQVDLKQRTFGYLKQNLTDLAVGNFALLELLRSAQIQQSIRDAVVDDDGERPDADPRPSSGTTPL